MMARPDPDPLDPTGLIRESFRIPGIRLAECRIVFFEWALSLPSGADTRAAARVLLDRYAGREGEDGAAHPMLSVLTEAADSDGVEAARRGGWRARR